MFWVWFGFPHTRMLLLDVKTEDEVVKGEAEGVHEVSSADQQLLATEREDVALCPLSPGVPPLLWKAEVERENVQPSQI